jgi:stress-induced morphogen
MGPFSKNSRTSMTPEQVKKRLLEAYPDGSVDVVDLTGTHDHYQVVVASGAFRGLTRVQSQRHVMDVFGPELKTGEVHALAVKAVAKAEPDR